MAETMRDEFENDTEIDLDALEQVSGGGERIMRGAVADLKAMIDRDGTGDQLKRILMSEGKAAAVNRCGELYPGYRFVCCKAVSAL